jgi:hypothetical protein
MLFDLRQKKTKESGKLRDKKKCNAARFWRWAITVPVKPWRVPKWLQGL